MAKTTQTKPIDSTGEELHVNIATDERLLTDEPMVRNPYNYDRDLVSQATGLRCDDPSLTQQQFLVEADINHIAEKFMRTGEIAQVPNMPTSGDFQGIFDFQDAMNLIKQAKDEFMSLPARIRSRFENDPAQLISFLEDPNNRKEAEVLGLVQEPEKAPTIDAPQAPAAKPGTPPSVQPEAPKT